MKDPPIVHTPQPFTKQEKTKIAVAQQRIIMLHPSTTSQRCRRKVSEFYISLFGVFFFFSI